MKRAKINKESKKPSLFAFPWGREWLLRNGNVHKTAAPAILFEDGQQEWWNNNKRHRIGGPAIIFPEGGEEWWQNDQLHREDGPAVIDPHSGESEWFLNGVKYDPMEWLIKLHEMGK